MSVAGCTERVFSPYNMVVTSLIALLTWEQKASRISAA